VDEKGPPCTMAGETSTPVPKPLTSKRLAVTSNKGRSSFAKALWFFGDATVVVLTRH